jgi:hypothetical protein
MFYFSGNEPEGWIYQSQMEAEKAALATHLAQLFGMDVPSRSDIMGFSLDRPFFAGGRETLKPLLFLESPTAFCRRMIFICEDA